MRKTFLLVALAAWAATASAQTQLDGPTMGWSSWNTYASKINAALIKRQAKAMVDNGLKAVGYTYVNIDDGFQGGRDKTTGQLIINQTRFPGGLKPVVDSIHVLGLKAGIYSDAGHNTCAGYYGGEKQEDGTGLYEHDQQDCDYFFKDMGFDFIKVDYCGGDAEQNSERLKLEEKSRYTAISNAIKNTGRDVRFNVCRWNYPGTWVSNVATSWRTTHDIADAWSSVKGIIMENLPLSAYSSRGHYNDMDMLEVGRSMTEEEDKTHFGMWCALNSPLLIGCDMSRIKAAALKLLTNKDLIALNQDTVADQAQVVKYTNECYVLVRDVDRAQGTTRALVVFNPTDGTKQVSVSFADLCLSGQVNMRDLFEQKDLGAFTNQYTVSVPAHGCRIYKLTAELRTEQTRYEAETAYISDYQEIYNNQAYKTGIYEQLDACSGHFKAGWLGCSAQNDLCFRKVYSAEGGDYQLVVGFIGGESRNIGIEVNGAKVKTITVNSGGWGTVKRSTAVNVHLNMGYNEIRLYNTANWMPDIDYIDLSPATSTGMKALTKVAKANNEVYTVEGQRAYASSRGVLVKRGRTFIRK